MSYQPNPLFSGNIIPTQKVYALDSEHRAATPFNTPIRNSRGSLSGNFPKAIPKHLSDLGHGRSNSTPFVYPTSKDVPVEIQPVRPLHRRTQSLGVNHFMGNASDVKSDPNYLDLPAGFVPAIFHEPYYPKAPRVAVDNLSIGSPATNSAILNINSSPLAPPQSLPSIKINDFLSYDEYERKVAYNLLYAPIHKYHTTIVDPNTRKAFAPRKLNEPATTPPVTKLILQSSLLPWKITIRSQISHDKFVTNNDVFYALHASLHVPVSSAEWDKLGTGSKAQAKYSEAFRRRCKILENEVENGIKRIDWLGGKTMFAGIETKPNGSHEVILSI